MLFKTVLFTNFSLRKKVTHGRQNVDFINKFNDLKFTSSFSYEITVV